MRLYCNANESKFLVIVNATDSIPNLITKIKDTFNSLATILGHEPITGAGMMIQKKGFLIPNDCILNQCFDEEDYIDVVFIKRPNSEMEQPAKRRKLNLVESQSLVGLDSLDGVNSIIESSVKSSVKKAIDSDSESTKSSSSDSSTSSSDSSTSSSKSNNSDSELNGKIVSESQVNGTKSDSSDSTTDSTSETSKTSDSTETKDSKVPERSALESKVWPNGNEVDEAPKVTEDSDSISSLSETESTKEEESRPESPVDDKAVVERVEDSEQDIHHDSDNEKVHKSQEFMNDIPATQDLFDSQASIQVLGSFTLNKRDGPKLSGMTPSSPIKRYVPDSDTENSLLEFSPLFADLEVVNDNAKKPPKAPVKATVKTTVKTTVQTILPKTQSVKPVTKPKEKTLFKSNSRPKFQKLSQIAASQPIQTNNAQPIKHMSSSSESSCSSDDSSNSDDDVQIAGKKKRRRSLLMELAKDCIIN